MQKILYGEWVHELVTQDSSTNVLTYANFADWL